MKILAINTSGESLLTALFTDGAVKCMRSDNIKRHNSALMPAVENLLRKENVTPQELDYICVVTGPGSFTGIRLGVTSVNAMAYALNKKIVSVNSLELAAYNCDKPLFMTVLDAGHGNYYSAVSVNGVVNGYAERTADEIAISGMDIVRADGSVPAEKLLALALIKINRNETVAFATPFYMKLSQAEREYNDRDNKSKA